jgi:DNA-binding winged helix-turn-helix (wHTH) protein/Flp pilus assembly protein TadD
MPGPKLRFGLFEVDTTSGELRKDGLKVKLQEQPFQVLTALLERPLEVVTRDELQKRLWPGDTVTDFDRGLNKAISRVRDALGDDAANPRFIATLPQRGYRWLVPLDAQSAELVPNARLSDPVSTDRSAVPVLASAAVPRRKPFAWFGAYGLLGLVSALALGLWVHFKLRDRDEFRRLEMQGEFYVSKWTEAEVRKGIELYQKAIALRPDSAPAYAGLGAGWSFLSDLHAPPNEVMPRSKAAGLTALRLNDSLAAAHVTLGVVKMQYEWDWAGAEQEYKRAIAIDPAEPAGHRLYAWLLVALGRFEQARREMDAAMEADPTNGFYHAEMALVWYFGRNYERCVEQCRRAIALDATSYWPHMVLGWTYEQQGKLDVGIEELHQANHLMDNPQVTASLGHAYAVAKRPVDARRVISDLVELSKRRYVSPYDIATVWAGLGDEAQTLAWLETAHDDRSGWLALWSKVDPRFDSIRSSGQFRSILRRTGLLSGN